jgi:transcription initiation factor TFIIIB Brf1 subunit/transcription initiation factor TFIIB
MPVCPECAAEMKWDRNRFMYVCKTCGLALRREELDRIRDKQRREVLTEEEEKKKRRKEYLEWWLSKEKK